MSDWFKRNRIVKYIMLFITSILITLMFPRGESLEYDVTVGTIWIQEDLIAPFSFPILKNPEVYRKELEDAKKSVYPVFVREDNIVQLTVDSMNKYTAYLLKELDDDLLNPRIAENPTFLSSNEYHVFRNLRAKEKQFQRINGISLSSLLNQLQKHIKEIYELGVLDLTHEQISNDSIAIRRKNVDIIDRKFKYYEKDYVRTVLFNFLSGENLSSDVHNALASYGAYFISPNLIYSQEFTQQEIEIAQNKVSKNSGIVNENERIVAKHDRITSEIKQKIESYKAAKGDSVGTLGILLQGLGKFLHVFAFLFVLGTYLRLNRPRIYRDNVRILIFAVLFLWVAFVTFMVNQISATDSIRLLIFIPAISMLLSIIFDSRIGFYGTIIIALICGGLRGNDYTFVAMNIVAGALAAYSVKDMSDRTQIFRSFFWILGAYSVTIIAFGLERFDSFQKIIFDIAFAGTNSIISPVLTYGLLIFFERIFKISTALTYLELTKLDHPLLRELSKNAPGSFNHSLTMGNLAEEAAKEIGANKLLARVGAYFHDIGKAVEPFLFVENMSDISKSPHEKLPYKESARRIIEHVSKGIELAREYKLPQEIINFIPEHHGTSVVQVFYNKALEAGEEPDINDYRYPGPKPQTAETAIVMLADACESATRASDNPSEEVITNIVTNIIKKRLEDGELDEVGLTFADIQKIKSVFIKNLTAFHHRRIQYSNQKELEKSN